MPLPITGYLPLTAESAATPVGAPVRLGPASRPHADLTSAAPDLVTTGVVVVAGTDAAQEDWASGLVVAGERAMRHHLPSAADVEIPVRLFAPASLPQEDVDAILSATMLQVLVAVS